MKTILASRKEKHNCSTSPLLSSPTARQRSSKHHKSSVSLPPARNEILQMDMLDINQWVHDDDRSHCHICESKFSTFTRKHHCRSCGEIICSKCSRFRYVNSPSIGVSSARVCLTCIMHLKSNQEDYTVYTKSFCSETFSTAETASIGQSNSPTPFFVATASSSALVPREYSHANPAWPTGVLLPEENERLNALYSYDILDTPPDSEFDAITQVAKQALSCQVAAISFIDRNRQWFKASSGLAQKELPRDIAFCAHILNIDEPTFVLDTRKDPRFSKNPLTTGRAGIRFYAAAPIKSSNGYVIGTILVQDTKVRSAVTAEMKEVLSRLATLCMNILEDHYTENFFRTSCMKVSPSPTSNQTEDRIQLLDVKDFGTAVTTTTAKGNAIGAGSLSNLFEKSITIADNQQTGTSTSYVAAQPAGTSVPQNPMESMCMNLLVRVTDTQETLAKQQGDMLAAINNHGSRIEDIEIAVKRMEASIAQMREQQQNAELTTMVEAKTTDIVGKSLLDALDYKFEHGPKPPESVSFSVFVGRIETTGQPSKEVETQINDISSQLGDGLGGLIVVHDVNVLGMLESSSEQSTEWFLQMQNHSTIRDVRVLCSLDSRPQQFMTQIYIKEISLASDGAEREVDEDDLPEMAQGVCEKLLDFMTYFSAQKPRKQTQILKDLSGAHAQYFPSNDVVNALIDGNKLMSLHNFIELFASPMQICIESEREWPVFPLIAY